MELLRVTPELLDGLAAIECAVFSHPWSAEALQLLCGDTAFGFAVTEGGVPVAYGGMLTVLDEGQITNIATLPAFRRRGLAHAAFSALLDLARERALASVTLEVRVSNAPAIALYQRLGFTELGRRKNFYTKPTEDAIVMGITL